MNAKGYWFAFVVGVSAGAIVALLYAPESGAKTRKRIGRGIEDGVESLEETASRLREQAEVLTKQAQAKLKTARAQVNDAVNTSVDTVTEAVHTASKRAQALV